MNKEKKFYIVIVALIIALGVCISIDFTKNAKKKNNNADILNIDCNDENCEKETKIKEKDDKKTNDNDNTKKDNNSSDSSNSEPNTIEGNGSESGSGTGSDNSSSTGTGTGTGNGSSSTNEPGTDNGNGTGSESESNSGSGSDPVNDKEGNNSSSDNGTTNETPKEQEDFIVSDSYQVWKQQTSLNIFNVEQIAPGDKGSYDFLINNNTSKNVKYNITFDEINEYNVNMLYKLKRNNNYVAGSSTEWVHFNELNLGDKVLNSRNNDSYTIEWKWVDSDNDTTVGRTEGAKYTLNISIKAAETDEFDVNASATFNPNTGDKILYYIELALLAAIILVLLIIIKRRQKD